MIGTATENYARVLYDVLDADASDEKIDGKSLRVWRGSITNVYGSLRISVQYYSKVRALLIELGCIEYLQRGHKGQPTVLVLHKAPPKEIAPEVLTAATGRATLPVVAETVERLERKVEALDTKLGGLNIVEVLYDFEQRLRKLEKKKVSGEKRTGGKAVGKATQDTNK